MKKILILILVLSLALMFVGCGDDDSDDTPAVTKVSFVNQTNADVTIAIDGVDGTLTNSETWSYTFDDAVFVDEDMLVINYTVHGMYIATTQREVTINKGQTSEVGIISEGGVITLRNDYYFDIEDLRIYTDNTNTGANVLTAPLATGDSVIVLRDPANYTLQVRLETDDIEFMSNVVVADNEATSVVYDKHVFAMKNSTASAISYKLDSESLQTVSPTATVERVLDETFGSSVELYYNGLYVFNQNINLDYNAQSYYYFDLTAQGGAIFVVNNTSANITEVYIAESSSSSWGPDYMVSSITPGNEFAWTVEAGSWDVKLVDDEGFQAVIENIQVGLNQSEYIDYSEEAKTRATSTSIKTIGNHNLPVNGLKVEAN